MNLETVSRMEQKLLVPTYDRQPLLLDRGDGVYVWDSTGKKYLDFLSGLGVNALGHNHPAIQKVIRKQAAKLIHTCNIFYHEYQAELAARLTKMSGLDRAFFSNSGTEAWDGALKLARAFAQMEAKGKRPKTRILALDNSFHGRTYGAMSTTGQKKYRDPFAPMVPGVKFVKFNDVEDLEKNFDATVCAVCIETIQGEGGIQPVAREFLEHARTLTEKTGALLILDEIQCGLGRTGKHFAYQHYGILPDMVTVAKPLAAGLPLGAILTTNRVAAAMKPGLHGTTFGGGPLACAVAIEFLRQEEKLLKHVVEVGKYFGDALEDLDGKHASIQDVRGVGLMRAVELDSADLAKAVLVRMREAGIIVNRTHEKVLRFLPPYIIRKKHIDLLVKELDRALSAGMAATGTTTKVAQVTAQKTRANLEHIRAHKNAAAKPKAGLITAPARAVLPQTSKPQSADAKEKEEEYAYA
ncbi:MAG TPA: aspartate aminotransferase family protein [Terriglobales bacterium]|nr:aspartate aminotransferase family protein [Terriglobales bacterium]